ncbi:MAG: LolA family protein [Myxococcota bacterium]
MLRTDAVETVVQKGTLIARASGQFRFEFTTPSRELHVGDVRTHTIWNPSNNQVIISSVPEDTEKTALHYTRWFEGLGALKDLYTITPAFDSSTAAHAVFTLTPRSTEASSGLLPVTMSIDITTKLPATVTVTDEYTTETIRFSGVKLNPPVDSKTFVFHPPEGADVIDMREEQ